MKLSTVFTRLTPNTKNWNKPSGKVGKCLAVNTSNRLYEELNQFGWEEWLFEDYNAGNKTCLGFLQAFNNKNNHVTSVEIIHLYTRVCDRKKAKQFYVGYIKDVKVLHENQRIVSEKQKMQRLADLNAVNINFSSADSMWNKCFNIQFEMKNVVFHDNFLKKEIQLNRGQFRFSLYDLKDLKHTNINQEINKLNH